jgi:hypothetical protein
MALSSTQQTANLLLNREVDARFWIATGYKPGQKLDMSIPTDHAMAAVWEQIHQQVLAEDAAGKLRLTYTDPAVQAKISAAAAASRAAAAHLDVAAGTTDPAAQDQHVQAAADAHAASKQHVIDAQSIAQVPPVDPAITRQASAQATAVPPPTNAAGGHHVAHAQAGDAPDMLGSSIAATGKPTRPPPTPPIHPLELATARREAPGLAQRAAGDFVGVMRGPMDPAGHAIALPSRAALTAWYNSLVADARATGTYIAAFDKHDPEWPGPIADGLGAEVTILVTASPPAPVVGPAPDPWAAFAPGPAKAPIQAPPAPAPTPAPAPIPVPAPPALPDTPHLTLTDRAPPAPSRHIGAAIGIGAVVLAAFGGVGYLALRDAKRREPARPRGTVARGQRR